jgi:uncharacterized protein involved in outer membrane biogenesis
VTTETRRRGLIVLKRASGAFGLLVLLVVLGIALAPSSFWRWLIIHEASRATGRPASIDGEVKVHLFSLNPELLVKGFGLSNTPWAQSKNIVVIKRFEATLSLKSLLRFHLIFPRVAIDSPAIDLERDASGRANWDFSRPGTGKTRQNTSAPLHLAVI